MTGRIIKGVGGLYQVTLPTGEVLPCAARGRFRNEGLTPLVGDHVSLLPGLEGELALIADILPRTNVFLRPPMANMDVAVIVFAIDEPAPDVALLDCMLVRAQMTGCGIVLVFNKVDAPERHAEMITKLDAAYGTFAPYFVSAKKGDSLTALKTELLGKTTFLSGPSGVGKTSLLNVLLDTAMPIGALSARIARGKNTTRHAELLPLSTVGKHKGGWVADTPGFSLLDSPDLEPQALMTYYPEFQPYLGRCRFDDCLHDQEPDCAVRQAVKNGEIPRGRYRRYADLLHTLQEIWKNRYK